MDMITVGAVDIDGKRAAFSQGVPREFDTSAMGYTSCAAHIGNNDAEKQGTSMSTPLVSGMIAVFLSQPEYRERLQVPGKVAANVKKLVQELSYNRAGGGDTPVAWNGLDVFSCGRAPGLQLRARGLSCAINATTTSTALTSTAPPAAIPTTDLVSSPTSALPSLIGTSVPVPPKVDPVPCYNFDVNAYGYCCPDENKICEKDLGRCYMEFTGEGVGGGGAGIVPTGAT